METKGAQSVGLPSCVQPGPPPYPRLHSTYQIYCIALSHPMIALPCCVHYLAVPEPPLIIHNPPKTLFDRPLVARVKGNRECPLLSW